MENYVRSDRRFLLIWFSAWLNRIISPAELEILFITPGEKKLSRNARTLAAGIFKSSTKNYSM